MSATTKWLIGGVVLGLAVASLYLVLSSTQDTTSSAQPTAQTSVSPTTAPSSAAPDVAGPIPTITDEPMENLGPAESLAPAELDEDSVNQAKEVAALFYDTLVDTSMSEVLWRRALDPLTTSEYYRTNVRLIDATWYDGLGTRTSEITIEDPQLQGVLYAVFSTSEYDTMEIVLVRPTVSDTWRVDRFKS